MKDFINQSKMQHATGLKKFVDRTQAHRNAQKLLFSFTRAEWTFYIMCSNVPCFCKQIDRWMHEASPMHVSAEERKQEEYKSITVVSFHQQRNPAQKI